MRVMKIDDKFSVVLDTRNNDRPIEILRHGDSHQALDNNTPNWVIALIYALDEAQNQIENQDSLVPGNY